MRAALLALLLLAISAVSVRAQDVHGRLEGRVIDSDGDPIERVDVTVQGPSLQGVRRTPTNSSGFFTFRWLPVGTYSVKLSRIGYETLVLEGIIVRLGRTMTIGGATLVETPIELEPLVAEAERKLIDPESAADGLNLTPDLYENLPVARDYRAVAVLSPMADVYEGTDLSIAGATGPGTKYFIEGTDVTNPVNGLEATRLPYNFVREVEIKTGGYEAEYRSTLGGIINVVTYAGGNVFRSQVFGFYTSDRLEGSARYGLSDKTKETSAQYDVGITLGGPILRDRLWYFAAYNPSVVSEGIGIPVHGVYDDHTTQHVFAGKLTWQAAQRTSVFLTAFGDPGTRDVVGPMSRSTAHFTPLNPEAWLGQEKLGGVNLVAGATQRLGERTLLELTLSNMWRETGYEPTTEAGYEPQFHDHAEQTVSGGTTKIGSESLGRTALMFKATREAGRHVVKVGGEFSSVRQDVNSFAHHVLRKYGDSRFAETQIRRSGSVSSRIGGVFAQDSWQAGNRWRLNFGLRWEAQALLDSNGSVAQTIWNQWQPRLGLVFQPGRIGTQRIYASAGRYYQDLALNGSGRFNGEEVYGWTFWDHDPRVDSSGGEGGVYEWPISDGTYGVSGQHYDELTLGYERQLGASLKVGARGLVRTLRKAVNGGTAYRAAKDPSTDEWYWAEVDAYGNPGFGVLDHYPEATRDYAALELTAEQTLGSGLLLVGSYVLSRTYGNYQGLWDTGYWSPSPNSSPQFAYPSLLENAEGLLPQDRTHVFKIATSYMTGIGLGAGARFLWATGTPVSLRGGSSTPPMFAYLAQRGSMGRTPNLWDLDLRFVYDMRRLVRRSSATRVVLDLFNVGSPRTPLAYDDLCCFTRNEQGYQEDPNPNYMMATRYQAPMTVRLGVEVGF